MTTPTTITASDVINQAMPTGRQPFSDKDINTACRACSTAVTLADCGITQGMETLYKCPNCQSTLLVIGAPNRDGTSWPGRGYRLHDFVLRNESDLFIGKHIRIPRSPDALAALK